LQGHRVAVKIIAKRKFFLNKKMEGNIQRELRLLDEISQMDHPNIVKTYGHIDDPAYIYIVMECCEGGELLEMLETAGNYTEEDCCEVIEQSCRVLQYLHSKGIVHRDIKPENMLLSDKDDVTSIKLADFGLANVIEDKGTLSTVCGSPAYMAPEVHKMGNYDGQVDMYSLGVMMYLMLSGVLPFHASDDMNQRMEDEDFDFEGFDDSVSTEARDVIGRLLRADPEKRATAEEVLVG
jgi:calcium-dependent protein kinase